jgi:hypothetical protein
MTAEILIGDHRTKRTFEAFQHWAYSSLASPFIRGGLVEYVVIQHLIDDDSAMDVFGRRIDMLTTETPTKEHLKTAFETYYSTQPSGDVFDLQVHWGLTFEIKTTANSTKWSLPRKKRWNLWNGRYSVNEMIFPAQYYILAHLSSEPRIEDGRVKLPDIDFFVQTGRHLDDVRPGARSISFDDFTNGLIPVKIGELAQEVHRLQIKEIRQVTQKFVGKPVRLSRNSGSPGSLVVPFYNPKGGIEIPPAYYIERPDRKWQLLDEVQFAWEDDAEVSWRDWEAVGFKYDACPNPGPRLHP